MDCKADIHHPCTYIPSSLPCCLTERKPVWLPLKTLQSGSAYQELMTPFKQKLNKPYLSGIAKVRFLVLNEHGAFKL